MPTDIRRISLSASPFSTGWHKHSRPSGAVYNTELELVGMVVSYPENQLAGQRSFPDGIGFQRMVSRSL